MSERYRIKTYSLEEVDRRRPLCFWRRANDRARRRLMIQVLVAGACGLALVPAEAECSPLAVEITSDFTGARQAITANALPSPITAIALPYVFDAFDRERDAQPQERAPRKTDGVYGRFDGELSMAPFVGAAYTQAGMQTELGIGAYYFHTAGLQIKYADGKLFPGSAGAPQSVSTLSLALRPLFLLRWSKNLEQGPSWLDLALDSLTLKVGGYYSFNRDADSRKQGLESELSIGIPLLGLASGPWLSAAFADRIPKTTHDGGAIDFAASLRLEWAFPLGG